MGLNAHDPRIYTPELLRLVSYPRTGSHWFRIIMEYYTGNPSFVQGFFTNNFTNVWGYHIHDRVVGNNTINREPGSDMVLHKELKKVIYLYRNPIDTIYSMLKYDGIFSKENFNKISNEYYNHLNVWLNDSENDEIIYITYEEMKNNPHKLFKSVFNFMNIKYDGGKLDTALKSSTKEKTVEVVKGNHAVMDKEQFENKVKYLQEKLDFVVNNAEEIINKFKRVYYVN